jgi:mannitol/fructose-specific phosphotransferase system IIA component
MERNIKVFGLDVWIGEDNRQVEFTVKNTPVGAVYNKNRFSESKIREGILHHIQQRLIELCGFSWDKYGVWDKHNYLVHEQYIEDFAVNFLQNQRRIGEFNALSHMLIQRITKEGILFYGFSEPIEWDQIGSNMTIAIVLKTFYEEISRKYCIDTFKVYDLVCERRLDKFIHEKNKS